MKKLNITVLASGSGTNLQALIDAQNNNILKSGKINCVITSNMQAFAIERAKKNGIKSVVVDFKSYPNRADFDNAVYNELEKAETDIIVFGGFNFILNGETLRKYDQRMINIHPSLIPSFCGKGFYGLRTHQAALDYGVKLTGATAHYVNEVCDGGEIILQKSIAVLKNDTAETLQKRVMEKCEWKILPRACEIVCRKILKEEG